MPKYISRSTGKIVYPDQIRSGEVTDAVEVDKYPEQAADSEQSRHVIDVPKWAQKGPLPEVNPFGKWFGALHVLSVLAVIGGMAIGADLAGGEGAFAIAVVGGLAGGLSMIPLYLLAHIGSMVWRLKEEVRKLNFS